MGTIYNEEKKLWINSDERPFRNLIHRRGQWILDRLLLHGSKIAQINADDGRRMTFDKMRLETIRVAQNLLKRGLKSHQVLGFMADNSQHLVPVVLASICLACPVASLHTMFSKEEIVRALDKSKPTVIFCDVNAYSEMNEALKEFNWSINVFTFGGQIENSEPVENLLVETGDESNFVPVEYDLETDVALMSFSSGSTGPSKCACLSYGYTSLSPRVCDPNDIIYSDETIYWTVGLEPIIDSIHNGATRLISMKPFSPELHLKLIEMYKVSILYISTYSIILCLKNKMIDKMNVSSIKSISLCGSKWPSNLGRRLRQYFPKAKIISEYGLTEICGVASSCIGADGNFNGYQLYGNVQAKVIDESGNHYGPGRYGEICFKVKNEFLFYLDDSIANADFIDDEGFFRTADIGYFDENRNLFIEDRKKNIINVFYFDSIVLPAEMETYLIDMPDISEACVVGIPVASGQTLPAAVVVRKPESTLTTLDIYNFIAAKVPTRSKLRGGVYFVDSLPKTHNGKLVRRTILELAIKMFEDIKYTDPDIQSYLRDIPDEFRKLI